MAGIGFELRKILKSESYTGLFQAYAYAGIISSGPWILSIIGVLVIGLMSLTVVIPDFLITQFQVSVTYLIVFSLILTGFLQPAFTRFIADRLFEKQDTAVLPNFHGAILVTTVCSGLLGMAVALSLFPQQSVIYRGLMLSSFVVLSNIWIATIFLSGMKEYKAIVRLFGLGYFITVVCALALRKLNLEGLLAGFLLGHFVLLLGMMTLTMRSYPSNTFISFDFLKKNRMYTSLLWVGFFYNLGIWIDKIVFWYFPDTSQGIIGPLRASLIYDLPIFLAYLSIIPGMAVFLVRMETDFVEYYTEYYNAVREGGSLQHIEEMRDEMVYTVRQGIFEIVKIQAIAVLITFVAGPALLRLLGISQLYLSLLYIDVVAAGLQVVFLGLLNVFFYLDKRRIVLFLASFFVASNLGFTLLSLHLGAAYYGYGFALSLLLSVLIAIYILDKKLDVLEYETFMLQK
jgi:uncharacterized membrane protein